MADLGAIGTQPGAVRVIGYTNGITWQDFQYTAEQAGVLRNTILMGSIYQVGGPYTSAAQIDNQGVITGKVLDNGAPVVNQVVHLYLRSNGEKVLQWMTDASGDFIFQGLDRADYYQVALWKTSYSPVLRVDIQPSSNLHIDLYTMTARRPLVLINGRITEAPDGTTWAVGVPESPVSTYSANVGDGSNVSYTITHSLGTRDLIVETRDNNSPYGVVDVDWEATTTNAITITFQNAPSTNRYRVNIIAV